jgi:hypothetical protein
MFLENYYNHEAFRVFLVELRCVNPHFDEEQLEKFGGTPPLEEQFNEDYMPTLVNPAFIVVLKELVPSEVTTQFLKEELQKDERFYESDPTDEITKASEVHDVNVKQFAIFNVHTSRQSHIADARRFYF